MYQATVEISGIGLYSQSRPHNEPKLNKEGSGLMKLERGKTGFIRMKRASLSRRWPSGTV